MQDDSPHKGHKATKEHPTLTCPGCGAKAELRPGSGIYWTFKTKGLFWACPRFPRCDYYIGCHPGTETPFGSMTNAEGRLARRNAHAAFDPLWVRKMKRDGLSKSEARSLAYVWLARALGISPAICHISKMDVVMCNRVVEVCAPYVKKAARLSLKTQEELFK